MIEFKILEQKAWEFLKTKERESSKKKSVHNYWTSRIYVIIELYEMKHTTEFETMLEEDWKVDDDVVVAGFVWGWKEKSEKVFSSNFIPSCWLSPELFIQLSAWLAKAPVVGDGRFCINITK